MASTNDVKPTGWVGWIYFAGTLMMVEGVLHLIAGFTALLNDKFYVVQENSLSILDFTSWGWTHFLVGFFLLMAGIAVLHGNLWGRIVALILAVISLLANFLFVAAYPIWSIIAIAINILVIYALTVHGNEA